MRTPALPSPRRIAAGAGLALLAAGLTPIAASAAPVGSLIISEVYGGGGGGSGSPSYTHDFIELYNPTASPVSLTGWSVQYKSNTGATATAEALEGTVAPGGYFLVQSGSAGTVAGTPALPTPDDTVGLNLSQSGGIVFLASSTTPVAARGDVAGIATGGLVDTVGFGTTADTYETARTGVALTITTSAARTSTTDTDDNATDFNEVTPDPQNSVVEGGPSIDAVAGKAFTVNEAITPFTVTATGGTSPYTWSAEGLPAGLAINETTGEVTGTPTAAGVSSVTVTATDADDATDSETFSITVNPAGVIAISEVQGTGSASPILGTTVTTRGIVTAAYPAGGFFGFYIQTPGTGAAAIDLATHTASDAVFVRQTTGTVTATPGDYVEVTGTVAEFAGATQVEVVPADIEVLPDTVDPIVTTTTATWPRAASEKESLEGMRYRPTGDFTVSNTFSTNNFGEVGLAQGDKPLIQRTEVELPGPAGSSTVEADNQARAVVLDDGASTNFLATSTSGAVCGTRPTPCLSNGDLTPPYVSTTDPVRVGAAATFTADVIFTQGGSPSAPTYRFQPLATVVGPDNAGSPATFEDTRTAAPDEALINEVGESDIKVASFNVLNYFTTLGDADNDNVGDGGCTPFRDRDGDGNTVNSGCDQRGAWDPQDFERQQSKIVDAINALDADVVGLMEIENSLSLGETADEATNSLVAALNADAGAGTWAANPSSSELPAGGMDVITNAIIYKPASVDRVGASRALGTLSDAGEAFDNAREPLGQVFEADAGGEPFLFVVNHFKSKGSAGPNPGDADSGDGQGASNGSRVLQATALRDWVEDLQVETGVDSVVLGGDFNSYAQEDPLQVLYTAGFTNVEQEFANGEFSYSFSGLSGSLDHILVNDAALARSTGTDIWNINGGESLALEYSRWNYHGTDFHAEGPYRSSDHDPVILGMTADDAAPTPVDVQILGTNDFHGRILNEDGTNGTSPGTTAGAAVLSGAVKQLRAAEPNTVFAAAGDLIGASTFESFILNDEPTIDALNEAGLEVSAVGNHEFDQGWDDLVNRVIPRAEWEYIGANVDKPGAPAEELLEPTFVKEMDGVEVGFIGAVTEHLDELVSPAGIEGVEIEDIVAATNREADALEAAGVDVIVLLVHEGAPGTNCATMDDDATSDFGSIITGVNDKVDAIVSGHTHLAYNCSFPVAGWSDRPVKERPVVSAGQYGQKLNQLLFSVDPATGEVLTQAQNVLNLKGQSAPFTANYPADPAVTTIVNQAIADAGPLGAAELGKIEAPFYRAKLADGTTENRGGESTLGNLVAEVQRWATPATVGGAQIAFMNPGGLRADMVGNAGDFPRTLTYRQAANVQSFANTLVNMDMTGAQIKAVLEQQWQPAGASRPFLRLGVSEGFTYTYDASKPAGSRVTGMWLDGAPVGEATSYSVTANSFLAGGGDNFGAFNQATGKQDTGKVDLAAMVDYMDEFANTAEGDAPLAVDYSQRAVGVAFGAGAPATYAAGDDVVFNLSSLSMTGPNDVKDTEVEVTLGDKVLGTAPVTTTPQVSLPGFDEVGTASVDVTVPTCVDGESTLTVTGNNTGTEVLVPVEITAPECIATTVTGSNITIQEGSAGSIPVTVTPATATGEVILGLGQMTVEATLVDGEATIPLAAGALPVGVHELSLDYPGDDQHAASSSTVVVTVTAKPAPGAVDSTVTGTAGPFAYGTAGSVVVKVAPAAAGGTVAVSKGTEVLGSVTLAAGQGTVTLPAKSLPVGTHTLTLTYSGDAGHKPSTGTVTVVVVKAEATVEAKVKPKRVVADKTRARVVVTVAAEGYVPTGRVKVLVAGKTYRAKLVDGKAVVKLREFDKPRVYTAKISYLGDDTTESARTTVKIKVKRR